MSILSIYVSVGQYPLFTGYLFLLRGIYLLSLVLRFSIDTKILIGIYMYYLILKLLFYFSYSVTFSGVIPLVIESSHKLPVLEMSGICLRGGEIVIVNDKDNLVHFFNLSHLENSATRILNLSKIDGAPKDLNGQWEGISCLKDGRLILLQESPARVLIISKDLKKVNSFHELILGAEYEKALNWSKNSNSLGEGIFLRNNGNLVIAKEKGPAQLIEFSRTNTKVNHSSVQAINKWSLPIKYSKLIQDISDLYRHPDGSIYLLSDQSRSIIKLKSGLGTKGGDLIIEKIWKLPKRIKKPEGFFIDSKGRAVIVVDSKKIRKKGNLFITLKL